MNDLQRAIDEAKAAVDLAVKRQRAKNIGAMIGAAIGAATYPHTKTDSQIDDMSASEIDTWLTAVESNPPEVPDGPPSR